MSLFDAWETVTGDLEPGVSYRITYTVTCLNSASPLEVSQNMSLFGFQFSPSASLTTGFFGATDPVAVTTKQSQDSLRAALAASFSAASSGSWIGCTDATITAIERLVKDGNNPFSKGTGFTLGIGVAAVIALAAVYLSWRSK